eukprot:3826713-Amphidinium_carterae.1
MCGFGALGRWRWHNFWSRTESVNGCNSTWGRNKPFLAFCLIFVCVVLKRWGGAVVQIWSLAESVNGCNSTWGRMAGGTYAKPLVHGQKPKVGSTQQSWNKKRNIIQGVLDNTLFHNAPTKRMEQLKHVVCYARVRDFTTSTSSVLLPLGL